MLLRILRSKLFIVALVLLALSASLYAYRQPLLERIIQVAVGHRLSVSNASYLPDGLHVALCGAGSQFLVDPKRSEPCVLVLAGQQLFVVGAGNKSTQIIESMNFGAGEVKAVFLTSLHSYQINGLGQLLNWNWLLAKSDKPLPVLGPKGVEDVVSSLNQAYFIDSRYKLSTLNPKNVSEFSYGGRPITIQFEKPDDVATISKTNDLEVLAFQVNPATDAPSLGYIFRYKGRSALITGDVSKNANFVHRAKGVDLLVHDALSPVLMQAYLNGAVKSGLTHVADLFSLIMTQHTSPEEAAHTATQASVKYLLLSGITPPLQLPGAEGIFMGQANKIYQGPIKIGVDGDVVSMPAYSDEFNLRNLITRF
jgi:ribonuclease Z